MRLGYLVMSFRGCLLGHLAHEVFKYYLTVLIMILEKTVSQYIPSSNAF